MWAFTSGNEAAYAILRGLGYEQAASVPGPGFARTLAVDGWAPYRSLTEVQTQTRPADSLRRCDEVLSLVKGAVRFPRAIKRLLKAAP